MGRTTKPATPAPDAGSAARHEAAAADARFQTLAAATADAVVVVDGANIVRFANAAAERLFEVKDGLTGKPFLLPLRALGVAPVPVTLPSGRAISVTPTVAATVWDGAVAWLGSFRADPSLASDTAQALDRALAAMRGRFLAHVSHELRTPLNSVIGFSELMAMEAHGPLGAAPESRDRYRAYAADIAASGERLAGLMSDLLDLARAESGELSLDEVRFDIGALLAELAPEGARVRLGSIEPLVLAADRAKLKRALEHLVANGLVHAGPGGEVVISVGTERDGRAIIAVADSGRGFSKAALARAFEPFARARDVARADPRAGAGIGLALVRHLAELHGGSVRIASAASGASVTLSLPAARVVRGAHPALVVRH